MKALILGGTRYVGRLVSHLLLQNRLFTEVKTVSRNDFLTLKDQHFVCDRKIHNDLLMVFDNFQPNVIIDMINFSKDDSQGMVNAFNQNRLPYLQHYVMRSSFFVYNHFNLLEYREKELDFDADLARSDAYTRGKIEAEKTLYSSKLMNLSTIIRLPFIFSADDYSCRFKTACDIAVSDMLGGIDDNIKYSLISKTFAAKGIEEICSNPPLGVVDLANSGCVTSRELCLIIKNIAGEKKSCIEPIKLDFPYTVMTSISIETDKISFKENLVSALEREAKEYFLLRN